MWKAIVPNIIRQRVIMEGTTKEIVTDVQIKPYLIELAKVTDMQIVDGPNTWNAHGEGYGGRVHWKTSGCVVYSYKNIPPLFTVDCYTCKPFSVQEAADFTKKYFNAIEFVWKEV